MRKIRDIQFLRLPLMALITAYLVGITFFTHTHIVNHELITHSHPFKDSKHSHSEKEFQFIQDITHFSTTTNIVPQFHFDNIETILSVLNTTCFQNKIYPIPYSLPALRAPPTVFTT